MYWGRRGEGAVCGSSNQSSRVRRAPILHRARVAGICAASSTRPLSWAAVLFTFTGKMHARKARAQGWLAGRWVCSDSTTALGGPSGKGERRLLWWRGLCSTFAYNHIGRRTTPPPCSDVSAASVAIAVTVRATVRGGTSD